MPRPSCPLLFSPGAEGLHSVELAKAMILSSQREKTISLPMDAAENSSLLDELITISPRSGGKTLATPPAGR